MNLQDTRITQAGVMRCCLATVADEYEEHEEVIPGDTSACTYCKREFTLLDAKQHPLWTPNDQIKTHE